MQAEEQTKLLEFVEAAKSKGAPDEFLASFLTRRGWPQDDVYAALGRYWERETGLPIPNRSGGGESSRDAFLYLLSFSTLATWACALGSMLFVFIDRWLPDPVATPLYYSLRSAVTWQMASIAVAFPIFLLVMRTILREAQDRPERLLSPVRKWLTYIALLLTAGAMIGDLIWFLDYFLTGELTSRFVLKALTVILIAGAIFIYYRDTNAALVRGRSRKFAIGAVVVVIAAFAIGVGVAGTPGKQRRLEADSHRIQDLRAIAHAAHSWYPSKELPANLSGFQLPHAKTVDPENGRPYEYRIKSITQYELCATFDTAEETDQTASLFWHHNQGRTCYTLDATVQPQW